jgi:hypothetical protein
MYKQKNRAKMNKRGQLPPEDPEEVKIEKLAITVLAITGIILLFVFIIFSWEKDEGGKDARKWVVDKAPELWGMKNFTKSFLFNGTTGEYSEWTIKTGRDMLGLNEGLLDFIQDFIKGIFIGLWLFIVFVLASWETIFMRIPLLQLAYVGSRAALRRSWLGLISGKLWKIIPTAMGYAILMQVPLINSFIKVVTFEALLNLSTTSFWTGVITSFIVAFYIGFLPAGIEAYTRYRIKKKAYKEVINIAYNVKKMNALSGG